MVGISDLLDSDLEDSQNASDQNSVTSTSPAESRTNGTATKKGKKRRCVTMPKAKARVTKVATTTGAKKPTTKDTAAAKRKAAEAQIEQDGDEMQETQAPTAPAQGRGRAKKVIAPEPVKAEADEIFDETMDVEPSPAAARSSHAPTRGRKAVPKPIKADAPAKGRKTAQTQSKPLPDVLPEDELLESDEDEMQIDTQPVACNVSRNNSRLATSTSYRRRAGSASDAERGDPNLRRKLGDITRKYENMDLKYRSLKDVAVSEAAANMDKLRKQCDATTQASNELIASLKKELAQQAPAVQESRKLKKQVQTNEQELAELRKANSTVAASLGAAQNEIKNLQAKLAAARSSSAAPAENNSKGPSSAMKHQSRNGPAVTTTAAAESAQSAQMKEELYRDLTGLIVRSVKRGDDGDTYDCIQTGRNGSKFTTTHLLSHPFFFPFPFLQTTSLTTPSQQQRSTSSSSSTPRKPRQPVSWRPSSCTRRCWTPAATAT